MKVKEGVKENIAEETKQVNKTDKPLSPDLLRKMNAYWGTTNYLSVGQIYLYDKPLLKEPLKLAHVKPLVVGHWGTTPGQRFCSARYVSPHHMLGIEDSWQRAFFSFHPCGKSAQYRLP